MCYIVTYRAGGGGRNAPSKRMVLGRCDRSSADQARHMAQETLGKVSEKSDGDSSPAIPRRRTASRRRSGGDVA